mgnify:CR=1 FL=1
MSDPSFRRKRYMRLSPSNGAGNFSFTNGNPIIKFSIPDSQSFLIGNELRFCGKFQLLRDGVTQPTNVQDVNIDRCNGLQGMISSIHIGSRRFSSSQLEVIHNYPRLVSSLDAIAQSSKGMRTTSFNEQGSVGKGKFNNSQNFTLSTIDADDIIFRVSRKSVLVARDAANPEFEFSMRLTSGLLSGMVDLNLMGGLELQLNLNANYASAFGTGLTTGVKYTISNPYLIAPLLYKSEQQIAQLPQQAPITYMSYQSLYSVIDSNNQSVVHRLNAKNLISVIQNYIPVKFINNTANNGMALHAGGQISSIEYHKSGVRFPLEYNIERVGTDSNIAPQGDSSLVKTDLTPQMVWNGQSAVKNVKDISRSQQTPENLLGVNIYDGVWTGGVSWDVISNAGVSVFGTLTYDLKTRREDPTNSATNPNHTLQTPYAQYSYYLSKNTLMASPQGIMSM